MTDTNHGIRRAPLIGWPPRAVSINNLVDGTERERQGEATGEEAREGLMADEVNGNEAAVF